MKLAEALIERADCQRQLAQLRERLRQNAQHQEGEQPAEDPNELLALYFQTLAQFESWVVKINQANHRIQLENGLTMVEALAKRDSLKMAHSTLIQLADEATPSVDRYSRSEIKMLAAVNVKALRKQIDDVAKQHRELDTQIQQANWLSEL